MEIARTTRAFASGDNLSLGADRRRAREHNTSGDGTAATGATTGSGSGPAPGGEGDGAVGGNAPSTDRSAGQTVDDAKITAAVKTKLLADGKVGGLKIDVDTRNGVVYLTGDHMKIRRKSTAIKLEKGTEEGSQRRQQARGRRRKALSSNYRTLNERLFDPSSGRATAHFFCPGMECTPAEDEGTTRHQ